MIRLGEMYKDSVTGFKGIAVCKTEWVYGCTRVGLQGTNLREGKVTDVEYFDELQLVGITTKKSKEPKNENIGGPRENPKIHKNPKR